MKHKLKDAPANDLTRLPKSIAQNVACVKCDSEFMAGNTGAACLADYVNMEVGFTPYGLQIWCRRHNVNVIHVDFNGQELLIDWRCLEPKTH